MKVCRLLFVFSALALSSLAVAQPVFTKAFSPDTIGPGSTTTLVFTIDNNAGGGVVSNLAFTDNLPAGVTIASVPSASSTCVGETLTAPAGGGTITFADGAVGAGSTCTVSVNVTSSTVATHMNVSGDLTSSAGNSGTATADLTVATDRPAFSKEFAPDTVFLGGRSTLTFTIDNSANSNFATAIQFSDTLPSGLQVASPSNASTTCPGATLTAPSGGSSISIVSGFLLTGETCTVVADVVAVGAGPQDNVSGILTSTPGGPPMPSGIAVDSLLVNRTDLALRKSFVADPAAPGATVELEFTVSNFSRLDSATGITFADDLDATLTGLVATSTPQMDVCGAGSMLAGTSVLTLTGGNLPAEGACTFSVTLQVPAAATPGIYPNTTSPVSGTVGGSSSIGNAASDSLFVFPAPIFSKTFLTNPAGAGDSVALEFTITNSSSTASATDIAFMDPFGSDLSGFVYTSGLQSNVCGAGSTLTVAVAGGTDNLSLFGGNLAPSASCTFSADFSIPTNYPTGAYPSTTNEVTATVNGQSVVGGSATDTLSIVGGPGLRKEFTDDPVLPGGTVTLEFELSHEEFAPADATGISFTDDLAAVVPGLAAIGLPANDVCGTGSQISGTTNLTFTGGTLAPGETCSFSVTVQVPVASPSGVFTNTTSQVDAVVSGVPVLSAGPSDDLVITPITFTKSFTDDPVIAGGTVTLEFSIENTSPTDDVTGLFFTDVLSSVFPGLQSVSGTQNDICGTGSSLSGTTTLIFVGGNLLAGEACTFSATLQVPGGTADGTYGNVTSNLSATIGGSPATLPPATDNLSIVSDILQLTKTFTPNAVSAGGATMLEFEITNLSVSDPVSAIAFTDDLDAALTGLAATGLPMMNVCGTGSQITGSGLLTFTGGALAAGASCTFSVPVQVPASPSADIAVNTTSSVTGDVSGLPVSGPAAMDSLFIRNLIFSKAFDAPTTATGSAILSFTIENLGGSTVNSMNFSDDLNAVLPGLVATGLPASDICGAGSVLSGSSFLTATGMEVAGGGSCTFDVTVQVPGGAVAGTYVNTTSDLLASGLTVAEPATADLQIEPPPAFTKGFSPSIVTVNQQSSTLTFTVNNTMSAVDAMNLDFTDNLPSGMQVAATPNAATTCTGGTLSAVAGSAVITYTGGSVASGGSCTISVDVLGTNVGMLTNTSGVLTSSSGDSGTAMATLTGEAPPAFAKSFAPNPIALGAVSTLTFTVDNSASVRAASGLGFTDNLPGGMTVAPTPNPTTTCAGTVSATPASTFISFSGGSVGAGGVCTVSVDVTADVPGMLANTSGALVSSSGTSSTASDTLTVNGVQVTPTSGLTTTEAGGSATFSIVLETVPANDVTIDLMSNNMAEGTVIPTSITFNPGNALTPRTIMVTGVDDAVADGPVMYSVITSDTMSTDPAYDGIVVADVTVTNSDNDTAGITVNGTVLTTDEFGAQATYSVILNTQPTSDVTVTSVSGDTGEVTVDFTTLTFTPANWDTAQDVTVTGVSDMLDDGDQVVTVDVSASSADPNYDAIDPTDVIVTNLDDQPPVALDDNATVAEEGTVLIDVVANDSDPDTMDSFSLTSVGVAMNGLTALEAGQVRYTPNAGFVGSDFFDYTITDSLGKTDSGQVNVTVTNVNDAPVAMDDSYTVTQSGTVMGNVLNNDSDVDSVNLTATLVVDTVNGTLNLNADGSFTYTQDGSSNLMDSFTYQVCDDAVPSLCDTAVASFNIQSDPPDLFITMSVDINGAPATSLARVSQGDTISAILDFGNAGNSDAIGVVVSVVIPAGTAFDGTQSDVGWTCDTTAGLCTLAVGSLAAGSAASSTISFTQISAGAGAITINASIADDGSAGMDANPDDNASVFQLFASGIAVPVGGLPVWILMSLLLLCVGSRRLARGV